MQSDDLCSARRGQTPISRALTALTKQIQPAQSCILGKSEISSPAPAENETTLAAMTNVADHPATRRVLMVLGALALLAIGGLGALMLVSRDEPPRSRDTQVARLPAKPDKPDQSEKKGKSDRVKGDRDKTPPKPKPTKPRPRPRLDAFEALAKVLQLCRCSVAQIRKELKACECTVAQLRRRLKEQGAGTLDAQGTKYEREAARRAKRREQRREEEEEDGKKGDEDDDPPPGSEPEDEDERETGGRPAPVPAPPNDLSAGGGSGPAVAVPDSR